MQSNSTKTPKRRKDKSQRATKDSVLDNRTLNILQKLVNRGMLYNLQGCLSSGKEANVYTAFASSSLSCKLIQPNNGEIVPCAIKIYQTSIMEFKDRLKYIQSERRFETFCNSNPRKLIKLWAEKEVRNLKRMNKCGINSPVPIYLKNNVLIMSLIQENEKKNMRENEKINFIENENEKINMKEIVKEKINMNENENSKLSENDKINMGQNEKENLNIRQIENENLNKGKIENYDKTKNHKNIDSESQLLQKFENLNFKPIKAAPLLKNIKEGDFQDYYNQCINILDSLYNKCGLIHSDFSEYNLLVSNDKIFVIDVGQSVEKSHDNADEFLIKDMNNLNIFFARKNCEIISINDLFEKITQRSVPLCLKDIDIGPGVFIPLNIDDVVDKNDCEMFLKKNREEKKIEENEIEENIIRVKESSSDSNLSNNPQNSYQIELDYKTLRKDNKKMVKELQREKRQNKIPKKEKKKNEQKYKRK